MEKAYVNGNYYFQFFLREEDILEVSIFDQNFHLVKSQFIPFYEGFGNNIEFLILEYMYTNPESIRELKEINPKIINEGFEEYISMINS